MAITNRATVKSILNISTGDATKDAWIDALIPQVESDYVSIRGKPFDVGTRIRFASTGALAADVEMTITLGNYASVGSTRKGSEYDIVLRSGDTAHIIARRTMNQIEPSAYYSVTAPAGTSTSADIYLQERFERWTENFSVLDASVTLPAGTGITATISKMETLYPDNAAFTAARMINYHITAGSGAGAGIQSETLGDYSVTFAEQGETPAAYPRNITASIQRYVKTL
jgi:hypothetical protein